MKSAARVFYGAGGVLALAALMKVMELHSNQAYLCLPDDALPFLTYRGSTVAGIIIDAAVAFVCFGVRPMRVRAAAVLWTGATFVGYHAVRVFAETHRPCPCLGYLGRLEGLDPWMVDSIGACLAALLLLTGAGYLGVCAFSQAKGPVPA